MTMRTWVVKIGSAMLTDGDNGIAAARIDAWAAQIVRLQRQQQINCVLVTSGAVAAGMRVLGFTMRPSDSPSLRAAAAVGQMRMTHAFTTAFAQQQTATAQVLLTHEDMRNRHRYINARSTMMTLLAYGVVPVVNENDVVISEENELGDNDTLAGLTVNLLGAEQLVILTDQAGVYDRNPRLYPTAQLIAHANADNDALFAAASTKGGVLGRGGMRTKINAARLAARSGANTVICNGGGDDVLCRLGVGERIGTFIDAGTTPLAARKQWLLNALKPCGDIIIDDGAVTAVTTRGSSLLPIGITGVDGLFRRGDAVRVVNEYGTEIARGLTNYTSTDVQAIKRRRSHEIATILGFVAEPEVIHRDNLAII